MSVPRVSLPLHPGLYAVARFASLRDIEYKDPPDPPDSIDSINSIDSPDSPDAIDPPDSIDLSIVISFLRRCDGEEISRDSFGVGFEELADSLLFP